MPKKNKGWNPMSDDEVKPEGTEEQAPETPVLETQPTRWQVKFKSGHGQQVPGASADEVRALMAKTYGEDYEIESIQEVK